MTAAPGMTLLACVMARRKWNGGHRKHREASKEQGDGCATTPDPDERRDGHRYAHPFGNRGQPPPGKTTRITSRRSANSRKSLSCVPGSWL